MLLHQVIGLHTLATLNDKDFNNLLSVYLDSSFFPNLDELDFLQEGHRLEFNDKYPDELEIKGVVYNEMKGAMSSVSANFGKAYPSTCIHHLPINIIAVVRLKI